MKVRTFSKRIPLWHKLKVKVKKQSVNWKWICFEFWAYMAHPTLKSRLDSLLLARYVKAQICAPLMKARHSPMNFDTAITSNCPLIFKLPWKVHRPSRLQLCSVHFYWFLKHWYDCTIPLNLCLLFDLMECSFLWGAKAGNGQNWYYQRCHIAQSDYQWRHNVQSDY